MNLGLSLGPPQVALIVWAIGAICVGLYVFHEFANLDTDGLIKKPPLAKVQKDHLDRSISTILAFMSVVTAVLWPLYVCVRLYLIWSRPSPEDSDNEED